MAIAGHGVDHGDHDVDVEFLAQRAVGGEGLQDRARIGEPAGLDHDAAEFGNLAALALGHQPAQRDLQVGTGVAADAAIAEQHGLVGARPQQRVVDADSAELVDHHGGAASFRRRQEALEQRGLAGAEEAGEHGDRDAGAARAPLPAPEAPGGGGGEQLVHRTTKHVYPEMAKTRPAKCVEPLHVAS